MSDRERDRVILIVEDNREVRYIFSEVFRGLDYRVLEAGTGVEAWQILSNGNAKVNVILTDLRMPVMDGLEFCTKVKNDPHLWSIPVVLLTATTLQNVPQALELFSAVLVKPCPFNKLISTVELVQRDSS
ncbi:response regulator [Herbaspirillum huttiense]|uniref:Response regulator n=1 Tax=Herbaspirillum huttiense subsp. lycopersici TaxID=3074428 RepID=A0ABU2EQS4_9BURK|nr:response regulator [Herbaspirillum huttiense]MDR9850188.1 response regulator [Herbaspirillum huttiense SE1]